MTIQTPKKKSRRWVKIIYLHLIADILALFLLFVFLKWWFPAQLVINQTEKFLKKNFGWEVTVRRASIDLFMHINLNDISISHAVNQSPVIQIKSVRLGYKVLPLILHKELIISYVEVDSPFLDLRTLPNGKWNLEALIEPFITEDTSAVVLPFLLKLDRCEVLNAAVNVSERTDTSQMTVKFSFINLNVSQLTGTSQDNLKGFMTLEIPDGKLDFQMTSPFEASAIAKLTAKTTIDINSGNIHTQIESHLIPNCQEIYFQNWKPEYLPEISFSADATVDLLKKNATTKSFLLSVDPIKFSAQIGATFDTTAIWSLQVDQAVSVELSELMKVIKGLNLITTAQLEQIPPLYGTLSLDYLKLSGSGFQPDSSDFAVDLSGKVSANLPEINTTTPIKIHGKELISSCNFAAQYSNNNLILGKASINGGIKEIKIDSLIMPIILNSLYWKTDINIIDQGKIFNWQAQAGIGNIFDGNIDMSSQATIDLPTAMEQKPEALKSFSLHATSSNLDMSPFGNGEWGGRISTEFQLDAAGNGQISADGNFAVNSPWITIENVRWDFPDLHHHINLQALANIENQSIEIIPLVWEWSDIANARLEVKLQPPEFRIDLVSSMLDISKLKGFIPLDLVPQIDLDSLIGFIGVSGWTEGSFDSILSSTVNFSGVLKQLSLQIIEPKSTLSEVFAEMQITGGLESSNGSLVASIGDGGINDYFPHLFKDINFYTKFQCDNLITLVPSTVEGETEEVGENNLPTTIAEKNQKGIIKESPINFIIDSLLVTVPSLALTGSSHSNIALNQGYLTGKISFRLNIEPEDKLILLDTISYSGATDLYSDIKIDSSRTIINGEIQYSDVNVRVGTMAALKGLSGRIPFWQTLNLTTGLPISLPPITMAHRVMGLPSYSSLQPSYHWTMPVFGTISVDSLMMMGYGISGCSMDASWKDGYFEVPSFQCAAYGGNIHGNLGVSFTDIVPDSLKFWFRIDVAGIQSAQIVNISSSNPEESIISGNADITIQGIPTSSNFDMYGGADITRIGRSVASDLLQLMDPEGRDEGIQSTRRYLEQGWGVKIFSFKIRDGFVYSYVVPSAPPLSKLHMYFLSKIVQLPPQITYGRIPIKFFMK